MTNKFGSIQGLDNLVTQDEMNTLHQNDNMTHELGFEPGQLGGESLGQMFSGFTDDPSFAMSPLGGQHQDGQMFGNALANQAQQQQTVEQSRADIAVEVALTGFKGLGKLIVELVKSFGCRTADDLGFLAIKMMIVGGGMSGFGIVMLLMAGAGNWSGFGWSGVGGWFLLGGIGMLGVGGIGMAVAAEFKMQFPSDPNEVLADIDYNQDENVDSYVANIEDSLDNIVADDLIDELDALLGDEFVDGDGDVQEEFEYEPVEEEIQEMPDFEALDRSVAAEKRTVTRASLVQSFLPYFMLKTPQFRDSENIEQGSQLYMTLRAVIVKAIANLQNIEIGKVEVQMLSARETFFSYKIVFERVKKLKNNRDLEKELETYFRDTVDKNMDEEEQRKQKLRIKCTVESSADTWEITINKGTSGIITLGDCLAGQREIEYFKKEKNALPVVVGITESGSVILEDAAGLPAIMVTGKPRSGKSWYVNSILTSLVAFNAPEDVSLIIVDPKNSTMFNTLALFPHSIGFHSGENINAIMREIIDIEAVKRAEALKEARCENIKDYNKMNPHKKMPYVYLVIDEVITVIDTLSKVKEGEKAADAKQRVAEFKSGILTFLSKLPYVGLHVFFVPHRATGIIDKTARTLLKLKAAVMAEDDEIEETLGEKIDRRLTAPGDIAMRAISMESARYVRGPAVADDDMKTADTLRHIAKGFYSMGVEIPNWSHLQECYVDNSETVQAELFGDTRRVQYN